MLGRLRRRRPQVARVRVPRIGTVLVRAPSIVERLEWLRDADRAQGMPPDAVVGLARVWLARLIQDADRRPFFTGPDDELLREVPVSDLLATWRAVMDHAGALHA